MEINEETKKIWNNLLNWIENIPLDKNLILYPLQLANAIRIASNDAVFIFDEVGCGKTLCSAIMAKTYLTQNSIKRNDDVLVITTNAVKVNKQFEDDFAKIDDNFKPIVFNNLVNSDLKEMNLKSKKWGLVIIDEAHEFSNTDTERYNAVKNYLKADKVVFLTATPLRGGNNLNFYKELANAILDRNDTYEALDELCKLSQTGEPKDLICSKFDPTYPVTRYFKDTLRYLDIHEKKEKAHRVIPEIWYPLKNESRENTLARNIVNKLTINNKSKFVIFVRFRKEALSLGKSIAENFEKNKISLRIKTIFAEEKEALKDYDKDTPELPTVLIINYQIGEAGVNLPGYDHVIHWHISSDPARLEQRYGRIDRMTSSHEKIYSCFVIPNKFDSNFSNLHSAIYFTMNELLTTLPARNVLLTKDTLSLYKKVFEDYLNEYQNELEKLNKIDLTQISDEQLIKIYNSTSDNDNNCPLYDFVSEKRDDITWDQSTSDVQSLREIIQHTLNSKIKILNRKLEKKIDDAKNKTITSFDEKIKDIEDNSDQIFYSLEEGNPLTLKTIDSQYNGCAKYIYSSESYILLQDIVKSQSAIRDILYFADKDALFAAELFLKLGDLHSFTNELPGHLRTPLALAYKYKR